MRVGVTVPMSRSDGSAGMPSWPEVLAYARHGEALGLDSVWVCDHFLSGPPGRPVEGIHEGWTILTALAASTNRVELGQLVMCASFRSPGLLAKMAVTADEVAGGRLILGIGAGWYDPEYEAFGYPNDRRVDRFEEYLQVLVPLVRGERVSFRGHYHAVRDAVLMPPPVRRIPILVAGGGPRMLRLTARYADAWNTAWYGRPDERVRDRVVALEAALEAESRDPATLRRTVGMRLPDATAAELADALAQYAELGFDDVIVGLEPMTAGSLGRLAEAVAATAEA